MGLDEDSEPDNEGCNLSCLVAIGRLHPHIVPQPMNGDIRVKPTEYVSRHAIDGKFVFVDQRQVVSIGCLEMQFQFEGSVTFTVSQAKSRPFQWEPALNSQRQPIARLLVQK